MLYVCEGCGAAGRVWLGVVHATGCDVARDYRALVARVRRDPGAARAFGEAEHELAAAAIEAARERDPELGGAA